MEEFLVSTPVVFRLEVFYAVTSILPILICVVGVLFYCIGETEYGYIPTLAEIMAGEPQARIFGVGITLESIFILFFGLLRDHLILFQLERGGMNQAVCRKLLQATRFLIVILCFSLIVVACVPTTYNVTVHITACFIFFASVFGYFIVGDFLFKKMNQNVSVGAIMVTVFGTVFSVLYGIFRCCIPAEPRAVYYGISSVCEYLAIILIFVKLLIIRQEMPKHGIRLRKKTQLDSHEKQK